MSKPCRASVRRGGLQANRFRYSCSTKTARRSKLRRAVLVELKATKTHTQIFKVNRREFYCVVELPLSDYPLYGKQLVARG